MRRNDTDWTAVGAGLTLTPEMFPGNLAWAEWSIECLFLPDDADQAISVDGFTNGLTDLSIDYVRTTPVASESIPVGTLVPFAGAAAKVPNGWLPCDGRAVARVGAYTALFEIIGTSYGAGDGNTTFNVPNLSGRFALGTSASHALAASGGEELHALTVTEMPSHDHDGKTGFGVDVSGTNAARDFTGSGNNIRYLYSLDAANVGSYLGDHKHTIPAQGSGVAHNTMPPFLGLSYIIKY